MNNDEKVDKIDDRQRQLEMLNVKITQMLERHDEELKGHEERLKDIEHSKIKRVDKITWIILAAIAGGIIANMIEIVFARGGL